MNNRVNINETEPQAYKGLYGVEAYLASTVLSHTEKELIKIRASQVNGCAFCIAMHTKDALKYGETAQRIFLLNAWREAGVFTETEKVILAITEEVTLIHNGGLSDATYAKAEQLFDKARIAQIIMAVVAINAWNRIAISTRLEPVL